MSQYPKVKFGDFVEHVVREVELMADKDYPSVGVKWYGEGVHVHEVKSGGSFDAARFEIKESDIIYNDMWARNGSVAIVPKQLDGAVASSHFPTFLPDLSRVLPKYLEYYFKTPVFWNDCENASRGSTGRNQIKKGTFYAIEVPLPTLDEQRRLVARIEALAVKISEAKRLRDEANNYLSVLHTSVLKAACEGRLETHNVNDVSMRDYFINIGQTPLITSNLPSLPNGWCWARAEDVCGFITKGTTPSADKLFGDSGDIPFIKVYNLTFDGSLDFSINPTFVSEETHNGELARSRLIPGDVLMNIVGPPLGKVSIVPDTFPEWNMNQAVVRFRPLEFCDRRYLSIVLRTESVLNRAIELAKGTAGQANLTLEICRNLPIPLPPLDEQRRIVAYLDGLQAKVDALKQFQAQTQVELEALLPSVLDKAFKGKL